MSTMPSFYCRQPFMELPVNAALKLIDPDLVVFVIGGKLKVTSKEGIETFDSINDVIADYRHAFLYLYEQAKNESRPAVANDTFEKLSRIGIK